MFFDIVGHLWWNLEAESDPDDPKSICFKAQDILRVLPHWWEYVTDLSEAERQDLDVPLYFYHELMKLAKAALEVLTPLFASGVERDERARAEHRNLHKLALSAYERRPTEPKPAGVQTAAAASPV